MARNITHPLFQFLLIVCCVQSQDSSAQLHRLIDVADGRIDVSVEGDGFPVVVLEAGLGQHGIHWKEVQKLIAPHATVVAYSRAGYGRSDPPTTRRTPTNVMTELNELLKALDLPGPYVIVGQSLGGLYARVFATLYPNDTAGLVFVDPTHERIFHSCADVVQSPTFWDEVKQMFEEGSHRIGGGSLPEFEELWKIFRRGTLPEADAIPDVPTEILTAQRPLPDFICGSPENQRNVRRIHNELFERSSNGIHVVSTAHGHRIHEEDPAMVADAVVRLLKIINQQKY